MPPDKAPLVRHDLKSLVIYDRQQELIFVADPEGRIEMAHSPETTFKRSRWNRWYRVYSQPWPGLKEISLHSIEERLPAWLEVWKNVVASTAAAESPPWKQVVQTWIDSFLQFHEQDGEAFCKLMPSVPILPPDAYRAFYVRVQEGCPWNRCAFCNFYKEEQYRVIPLPELKRQLMNLRSYWGCAIRSRHGLFLGDANAVAIPAAALLERLDLIRAMLPEPELIEIHSFVDFFSGVIRTEDNWKALRAKGLRRVSLGIESGDADIMELVDKPVNTAEISQLVCAAGNAGISLNLIFLVGIGGRNLRSSHLEKSLELIKSLGLKPTDRIYLSPLVIDSMQPYSAIEKRENWESLSAPELHNEISTWQLRLKPLTPAQVSPYHIQQFIY